MSVLVGIMALCAVAIVLCATAVTIVLTIALLREMLNGD
jgi:hypothetical protein